MHDAHVAAEIVARLDARVCRDELGVRTRGDLETGFAGLALGAFGNVRNRAHGIRRRAVPMESLRMVERGDHLAAALAHLQIDELGAGTGICRP